MGRGGYGYVELPRDALGLEEGIDLARMRIVWDVADCELNQNSAEN